MKLFLRIAILITIFAFVAGCGKTSAPKTAFLQFNSAVKAANWSAVWDMLSKKTQKAFEEEGYKKMKEIIKTMPKDVKKEKIPELGVTNEELMKLSPKDFFILILQKTNASKEFVKNAGGDEVEKVHIKDNVAKLKIKNKNEVATMVLEDGKWKMEFEEN